MSPVAETFATSDLYTFFVSVLPQFGQGSALEGSREAPQAVHSALGSLSILFLRIHRVKNLSHSTRCLLDDADLVIGQVVELVDEPVDLLVGRYNLALDERFLVIGLGEVKVLV